MRSHAGKGVSRVLFVMAISLNRCGWPRRRLRGGSRLPALASNLLAAESEIAAGRIALFSPRGLSQREWFLLLSRLAACLCGLSTRERVSPAFTGHPCSSQLGLSSNPLGISGHPLLAACEYSHLKRARTSIHSQESSPVPRGRFELPRGYPHYALNVARLPVPPHRPILVCLPARSRPADSNRRPAVYETAALPTELGRHTLSQSERSISGAHAEAQRVWGRENLVSFRR